MKFEWNNKKELINIIKHKVSFSEAANSFKDKNGFSLKNDKHSETEERYFWIGKSNKGRIITTRFTLRKDIIRIIGAAVWRKFRRLYYERTQIK